MSFFIFVTSQLSGLATVPGRVSADAVMLARTSNLLAYTGHDSFPNDQSGTLLKHALLSSMKISLAYSVPTALPLH